MKNMKCFVCSKVLYSDALAKACRLCGMPFYPKDIKKDFCCDKCKNAFKEIQQ